MQEPHQRVRTASWFSCPALQNDKSICITLADEGSCCCWTRQDSAHVNSHTISSIF